MKQKTVFLCNECGYESPKWYGKCPSCGAWNSMDEFKETKAPTGYKVNSDNKTFTITANEEKEVIEDAGEFVNTKLSALPETGGIGTTLFTFGGIALILIAGVMFIVYTRKQKKQS